MKHINLLSLLVFVLMAACGTEQPPADVAVEQPAPAEPADAVAEQPDEEPAEEEAPELVEESEGTPDESQSDEPLLLARAETAADQREWKFKEGEHFTRLVPAQPTVGGADKIEVAEFFWYGCPHCYDFEPHVRRWLETIPANVRFVVIPAAWNPLVTLHAQLYYTEEVLVNNGKIENPEQFRNAVFAEYHRRGNRMASEGAIQAVFEKHGVSAEDFQSTWNSFEVAQKMRVGKDLALRYGIASVPAVVVNGKYRTAAAEAGGYPRLMELIDELIARETVR